MFLFFQITVVHLAHQTHSTSYALQLLLYKLPDSVRFWLSGVSADGVVNDIRMFVCLYGIHTIVCCWLGFVHIYELYIYLSPFCQYTHVTHC